MKLLERHIPAGQKRVADLTCWAEPVRFFPQSLELKTKRLLPVYGRP